MIAMTPDYVLNGRGYGNVGQALDGVHWDPGLMRPYFDDETRYPCVNLDTGQVRRDPKTNRIEKVYEQVRVRDLMSRDIYSPVTNATALRKQEWQLFDTKIHEAFRARLRAWPDLVAASSMTVDGMSKTIVEHETMSDVGTALTDMDGLTEGRADQPLFQLEGVPLPIHHVNFWFSDRQLQISRNTGTPLNTRMAEMAARRIAERMENILIGLVTGITYGVTADYGRAPTVYGYTNFTPRNTYTSVTTPTGSNPQATVSNVLAMRDLLYGDNKYGPYMLYHSNDWDQFMDNDYAFTNGSNWATNPNMTLRQRLRQIGSEEGGPGRILDVRRLDFWTPASSYQLLLIDMTSDTVQAVIGMNPTTIQWDSRGGQQKNFKVMAINAQRLFADYSGKCGICHGTTS